MTIANIVKLGVATCCLLMHVVNAFDQTVVEKSEHGALIDTTAASNELVLTRAGYNLPGGVDNLFSVFTNDGENGKWVNNTDISLSNLDFSNFPHGTISFFIPVKITYDTSMVIGRLGTTDTTYYIFRIPYDKANKQFGTPTYHGPISSSFSMYSRGISPNGNIIVDEDPNDTMTTYYWSANDYVLASTFSETGMTSSSMQVGDDFIIYGLPNSQDNTAGTNTRGNVKYRSWLGSSWGSVEETFLCPSRPDYDRRCYAFGSQVWMNADKNYMIASAPDSSNTASSSNENVGAYVYFRHDGTSWDSGTIVFPYQNGGNNARLGQIMSSSRDYAIVEYNDGSWYKVLGGTRNNIIGELNFHTVSGYPNRLSSGYSFTSTGGSTSVVRLSSSARGTSYTDDVMVITDLYKEVTVDPKMRIINNPGISDTTSDQFGYRVAINGDYAATISLAEYNEGTTDGILYIMERNVETDQWSVITSTGPDSPSHGATTIQFGYGNIKFDGSTVVVSAPNDRDPVSESDSVGSVWVYSWDETTKNLTFQERLFSPVKEVSSQFGNDIDLDGDRIIVGQQYYDGDGISNAGTAIVFERTNGVWDSGTKLPNPTGSETSESNDRFGRSVAISGDSIAVCSGVGASQPVGALIMYNWNGTGWEINGQFKGQSGTSNFCLSVVLDDAFTIVGASFGNLHVFEKIGGNWGFKELIIPTVHYDKENYYGQYSDDISLKDSVLVIGSSNDAYKGLNTGSAQVFIYNGVSWQNDQEQIIRVNGDTSDSFASSASTDGSSVIFGAPVDVGEFSNTGRVYIQSLFETCTVSSTCSQGKYCGPANLCVTPKICDVHTDCINQLVPGRLPYCNPTTLKCEDKYSGSCTSQTECRVKATQAKKTTNGIGAATLRVRTGNNMRAVRNATEETISRVKATVQDDSKLAILVKGTETIDFVPSDYESDPNFADKVKAARCQDNVDLCSVTVSSSGGRRALQSSNVTITITYTFDEEAYSNTTGFDFDDPAFLQALADSLGVNPSEIDVTGDTSGTVDIEVTLTEEPDGTEPLGSDLVDQINTINDSLDTIGDDLASELGLNSNDISTQSVDLCGDRDCSGFGTCNEATGVCTCTNDRWGINCETICSCENGGVCHGSYCVCPYPWYGQRCQNDSGCQACEA